MRLTLTWPPSANVCWRNIAGRTLVSREYRAFKEASRLHCLQRRVRPMDGALKVCLTLYRPRRVGDIDNRIKPVLDALNGFAWADDAQIVRLEVERHDDKAAPRVEVEVSPFVPHDTQS